MSVTDLRGAKDAIETRGSRGSLTGRERSAGGCVDSGVAPGADSGVDSGVDRGVDSLVDPRLGGRRRLLGGILRMPLLAMAGGLTASLAGLTPKRARAGAPRVLIVGDSMIAGALGLFLENQLREQHGYEVHRYGKSSTGLARPDFFSWIKEGERQIEAFPEPDAVVAMFGGNDVQGLYMGREKRKGGVRGPVEWITWHDEGWRDEYARRITEFADIVAPDGRLLFWISMPVMRPEKFHSRVRKVNTIARAEMAIRPGGRFVDIWRLLADREGNYADRIEVPEEGARELEVAGAEGAKAEKAEKAKKKRVRVRAGDGIHLSVAGAHIVEAYVRERIVKELGDASAEGEAEAAEVEPAKASATEKAPALAAAADEADEAVEAVEAVERDERGEPRVLVRSE